MLHHIVEYAKTHVLDSEPGFTKRPIHWLLHISPEGRYINIEPYSERKKGKNPGKTIEERCPDMPNMRAGKEAKRAHFLVENTLAAVLYAKDEKSKENGFKVIEDDKAVRRNAFFRKMLCAAAMAVPHLKPAADFFSTQTEIDGLRLALGANNATVNDWIMFRVGTFDPLHDEAVLDWWKAWLAKDFPVKAARARATKVGYQAVDLITGELVDPKGRHPPLKGLEDVGGNQSGTPLACFDKQAFRSYGLKEGANASMSAVNAQLYVDGLTHLLKASHRIADARIAYWYRKDVRREDDPLLLLYSEEQIEARALAAARNLLKAIDEGEKPDLVNNQYFAITLSGAAGRAMVRDWMEGDFKDLVANVKGWFADLEVVGITGKKVAPEQKLETIVTSLLADKKRSQKYDDWVKPIGPARGQLLHAAIQHQPIPRLVVERLAVVLPAFLIGDGVQKALFPGQEQSADGSTGLAVSRLYARMGLIRAYFIRLNSGGDKTMTPYLNPEHPIPAYHCGRLLAVLANLQREALDDVGANVVQRFYTGFSQTPGLLIGRLIANAQNHLSSVRKRNPGLAWWYEDLIAEVEGRLNNGAPRILGPEGQGLFALGYYQQLAKLRAGNKSTA